MFCHFIFDYNRTTVFLDRFRKSWKIKWHLSIWTRCMSIEIVQCTCSAINMSTDAQSVIGKTVPSTVGERVQLHCNTSEKTPVNWYFKSSANASRNILCSGGNILHAYSGRLTLDRSIPGDFSLVIVNVSPADAGVYICKENAGRGAEHRVALTVEGKNRPFKVILNHSMTYCILKTILSPYS